MTRTQQLLLLFVVAFLLRLLHLFAIHDGPLLRYLLIDSQFYAEFGRRLASGGGLPPGPFFMNVLYGFFLAAIDFIFRKEATAHLAALVVQGVLGSLACVHLAKLGETLGHGREGRNAGWALAIYGPALFYDEALLTPSLVLFLTTWGTLLVARLRLPASTPAIPVADARSPTSTPTTLVARARPHLSPPALLGLIAGLLTLARANHALLALAWAGVLGWRQRSPRTVLVFAAAAALLVLPVTIYNRTVSGEWIFVSANGGMALWAGNHEGATGIYSEPAFLTNPVPEREAEDYRLEASRRSGRELTLAQSSDFWTRATARRWIEDPGSTARLLLRKLRIFCHATESQTNLSYYFAMDHSWVLRVARPHWGWIFPWAMLGLLCFWRRHAIVTLPILVSLATCLLFYVSSEYRHPVVPGMLFFAALGFSEVVRVFRKGSMVRRAAFTAGLVAFAGIANGPDAFLQRLTTRRVDYFNFATLALDAGDLKLAESLARHSVEIDPAWGPSRRRLAETLARQGKIEEASKEASLAAKLEGEEPAVDPSMAEADGLFQSGAWEAAIARFLAIAQSRDERRPAALNNAALAAMKLGREALADSLLIQSIAADSTYASPWVHRGRFALARGDRTAAVTFAREALARSPEDARALRLLERATSTSGGGESE